MTVQTTPRPRLFLSQDADMDRLSALEFGAIDDGQPGDRWVPVGEQVGLLHDAPGGRCVGFLVLDASTYDPDDHGHETLWDGPRFDAPALGLTDVAPNEIMVATRALFGAETTVNRELFGQALRTDGIHALRRWLRCLQAGDSMAHYSLGYTLYSLGRYQEAYRHLRHYAEIAPAEAWAWAWYGRAAASIGEIVEARRALERAIELDADDESGANGDATEILEALAAGTFVTPDPEESDDEEAVHETLADALFDQIRETMATANSDGCTSVLVDATPPVWVHVDHQSGDSILRAQIGTVALDLLDELIDVLPDHFEVTFDSDTGDLFVDFRIDGLAAGDEVRSGLLRPAVFGVVVAARELLDVGLPHGIEIHPPRGFDEEYRRCTESRDP